MKKIVIGIDVGISTTKIVGIDASGMVISVLSASRQPTPSHRSTEPSENICTTTGFPSTRWNT